MNVTCLLMIPNEAVGDVVPQILPNVSTEQIGRGKADKQLYFGVGRRCYKASALLAAVGMTDNYTLGGGWGGSNGDK